MKNILIATLGNRDVQIEENGELKVISPCRIEGEKVYTQLQEKIDSIRIPLIAETLKFIQHDAGALDKVYLIVTDQSNLRFSQKDTVWFGNIISAVLRNRKFAKHRTQFGFGKLRINNVEIVTISEFVKDFDKNFAMFNERLARVREKQTEIQKIYLEYTGGIPEINYALVLAALLLLDREKLVPLAIDESMEGSIARETSIIRNLGTEISRIQLAVNMCSYNYRSPLRTLTLAAPITEALQILACRLDFDFEGSRFHLQKLCALDRNLHEKIDGLLEANYDVSARLLEIFYQMEIKLQLGSYLDFLARLYCFYENFWQFLLIEKGYQTIELNTEKEREAAFQKFLNDNPSLLDFLKREPFYKDKEIKPSTKFNFLACKFFHGDGFKDIEPIGKRLERLVELRNRTAIAHRLAGVSPHDFSVIYPEEFQSGIIRDLKCLLAFANIQVDEKNLFDRLNESILQWAKINARY